jgi:2-keto-3-deoxy-L-rhamnonate aldolase RhmA
MRNSALEKLRNGEAALGVALRQARSADTAIALETAGFDWLLLDLEHNAMSIETAANLAIALLPRKISAIARVPERQYSLATRLLDNGIDGIVIPHVNTAAEAMDVVRELRYPPIGGRSIGSMQPHVAFRDLPVGELIPQLEHKILLAIMIESREAVDNCEEIAAVDGIDVVMIGANDLTLDYGVPGDLDNPEIVTAFARVAEACRKHGRYPGFGGVRRTERAALFMSMGFRFLFAADDLRLLISAGSARVKELREAQLS